MNESEQVKVWIIRQSGRKQWQFRWLDPVTGASGQSNSGVAVSAGRSAAATAIPAFIQTIEAKRPAPVGTWEEFCSRVQRDLYPDWRPSTRAAWECARRQLEAFRTPESLADVDADLIAAFRADLRARRVGPDSYLRTLRSVLRSAAGWYPSYKAPTIRTAKQDAGGRPLSRAEVKALLEATDGVVGEALAIEYRRMIRIVTWTGLRKKQAVLLSWDPTEPVRIEGLDGRHPELVIERSAHKGKRLDRFPLLPPAVAILRKIPRANRVGPIFKLGTSSIGRVGELVAKIGKKAGVVTGRRIAHYRVKRKGRETGPVEVDRYASMHDLKRTFVRRLLEMGFSPTEVARLAQHQTFETTWEFYTPQASELGDRVRSLFARAAKKKTPKIRVHRA